MLETSQISCTWWMVKKLHLTKENHSEIKINVHTYTWNSLGGYWDYYTKWKKEVTEDSMLYDFRYMKFFKGENHKDRKMWVIVKGHVVDKNRLKCCIRAFWEIMEILYILVMLWVYDHIK